MAFSPMGRKKVGAHLALLLVNIIVLALSSRVNSFQEYFYVADLFPFSLSIICLVMLGVMILLDFALNTSFTGRPQFEIGLFGVLSILWLSFNAFSTSRWSQVPMNCNVIPAEFSDTRAWCRDLQALKAFIWIEFLMFAFITAFTLWYTLTQKSLGNKHIFKMPLSRYYPGSRMEPPMRYVRGSEFLQY